MIRVYRDVGIFPKNVYGMYSAIVPVAGGGQQVAADTLDGIKILIRDVQHENHLIGAVTR